ncbi:hypothetical protein [Alkalinema sp. FACHB-956]|uniref:hypothetical protein n=1 Tax=Alkalinema sp. FACHB-956 TaxID=2692768 RepID=UPI0016861B1E|nr:hypothetical protein [Alkalinema sp. FACHB-956]MBD2329900.1 hypothetical protein [Alkalinema sp. FACHB-956]
MMVPAVVSQPQPAAPPLSPLDVDSTLLQQSPTLRKWLNDRPNVLNSIRQEPSFRTRLRVGYTHFAGAGAGWTIGLEDWRIAHSPITVSAQYSKSGNGESEMVGSDLHLYLRPLGSYVNVAPVVGYRSLRTIADRTDGWAIGGRFLLVPSRGGGSDLILQQTWVNPGTVDEVGIGQITVGYAVTPQLRVAAEFERWRGRSIRDHRIGIGLEWLP